MQCELKLYLRGRYLVSEDLFLADDKDELTWECNCRIRDVQMKASIEMLKLKYVMAITKVNNDYKIIAVLKSKVDNYEPDIDFSRSEEGYRLVDG